MNPFLKKQHSHVDLKDFDQESSVVKNYKTIKNCIDAQLSKIFVLEGPSDSGKSALAHYISKKIKPSMIISGAVFNSPDSVSSVSETLRKCVNVQITEERSILCGEVFEMRENENKMSLRTKDVQSEFSIGNALLKELKRLNVCLGDIIQINKDSGTVQKLGKTFIKQQEKDVLGPDVKIIDTPTGDLLQKKAFLSVMSLDEADCLNESLKKAPIDVLNPILGSTTQTRDKIDAKIEEWLNEGSAELRKGVLIIEDAHFMHESVFHVIKTHLQRKYMPSILLITQSFDLLNAAMNTNLRSRSIHLVNQPFSRDAHLAIINVFCRYYSITINDDSILQQYVDLAEKHSVKYALDCLRQISSAPSDLSEILPLFSNKI